MPTNFPTALDTFPSAVALAANTLNTDPHSTLHGNIGDAIAALEAKVGVDGSSVPSSLDYLLSLKAALASPTFTGTPSAPTAALGTNTTQLATTAFVLANAPALPPDVARTGIANTFTVGPQTIQAGADGNVALIVKGNSASQSAPLQEWQNSSGAALFSFSADGTQIGTAGSGKLAIGGGFLQLSTQGTGVGNNVYVGVAACTFGYGAVAHTNSSAFGHAASAYPHTSAIAIGRLATTTANNQLVIGSASDPINQIVLSGASSTFMAWHGQSSTSTDRVLATIATSFVVSTDATFTTRLTLSAQDYGGSREGLRIEGSGSAALIGFLGANAVARPTVTGSRAGNAALASLLSALASLGLITDSTSA